MAFFERILQLIPGTGATDLGKAEDTAHASGDTGVAVWVVRRDADTSLVDTDGDYAPLQVNAAGQLKVAVINTVTISGTVTANAGTNLNTSALGLETTQAAIKTSVELIDDTVATLGTTTYTETTTKAIVIGAVRRDADTTLVDTTNEIAPLQVNAAGQLKVAVIPALPAGTNAIGKLAANSGVDIGDVDVTSIAAGTNNIGQVSVAPQTANGLSVLNATSSDGGTALTNSAQVIKASAGQVYGWYIYNPNSTAQFVQFYNTAAASVVVGTTNPLFMLTIPPLSAANVEFTNGITFSNAGFSCSATSTAGGNGAPTTALDAVIFYK